MGRPIGAALEFFSTVTRATDQPARARRFRSLSAAMGSTSGRSRPFAIFQRRSMGIQLGCFRRCRTTEARAQSHFSRRRSRKHFVTGEVVATPDEELPFAVVFKRGDEVLAEWLVESVADGEAQIIEALKGLVEHDEEGPAA